MRLAFWRSGKDEAVVERATAKPAPVVKKPVVAPQSGDLDLHALGKTLLRKRHWIILPTLLVCALSITAVNMVTPRYKSEARILVDGRENVFLRPNGERNEERSALLDAEAVTSQVQLLLSRDLVREVISKNKLAERPEFDPVLERFSPLKSLLPLIGIGRDPLSLTPEERVLEAFYDRYAAYAIDKSRVIAIEFQSRDPDLAARVANSIAEAYLVLQQGARQQQARSAGQWLSGEIEDLRKKVAEADSRVEDFRSKSGLFVGTNNTTLSNQQMGEINTQLNNARALQADADSKARLIKDMLQGKPIDATEVLNSERIRRIFDQRASVRAQLAEQSSTLLDGHPRIKELKAQLGDLDRQLRDEAGTVSRALESDARIAAGRVGDLTNRLDQLKKQASATNGYDVQLRALEREAKAQRDLLESYLAKYREANTRENIEAAPADGRIISRATVSNTPTYPKKLPIVLIATLATLLLTSGAIATGELLRMTAPREVAVPEAPVATLQLPAAPATPYYEPREQIPAYAAAAAAARSESQAAMTAPINEIEQLAAHIGGGAVRKVTVLGTAAPQSVTLTALTLARRLARDARVVLVDLAASSPTIAAVSADPNAPGLADLMQGMATFAQIITRDRLSRVHLVNAGHPGFDRSLLQSPRLMPSIDALLRVYDYVVLDAGAATDLPAQLLALNARAVVVPGPAMDADARNMTADQLRTVGFTDVTMLSKPFQPSDAMQAGPRAAA